MIAGKPRLESKGQHTPNAAAWSLPLAVPITQLDYMFLSSPHVPLAHNGS